MVTTARFMRIAEARIAKLIRDECTRFQEAYVPEVHRRIDARLTILDQRLMALANEAEDDLTDEEEDE